tara:strand:+ start:4571 stop:5428 length:858 start_codon:yes stop_codon:yes gene_type:complete
MRTAAIGCSHTSGYHVADIPKHPTMENWPFSGKWHDNNWAEYYINDKGNDGVIFANPQHGWWSYSEWLSHLFQTYNDISEVVVQMTYWNRFRLAVQYPMHYENLIPLDILYTKDTTKGKIDCWFPKNGTEDNSVWDIPMQAFKEDFQTELPFVVRYDPEFKIDEPDLRSIPYMTVKTHMEIMSLKAQREWFKEIYILQEMCRQKGASLKLFGLNSWTWIPKLKEMNKYFDFNYIQVAEDTVEDWFLQKKDINVGTHTLDGEHFDKEIHKMIALEYIPSQFRKEDK